MKTYLTPVNEIERKWYIVDAQRQILGRLASQIASRLRGKHKPNYSTFQDTGDFVVVVNAEKVRLTGKKLEDKKYYNHSGYIGRAQLKKLKVYAGADHPHEAQQPETLTF